MDKNTLFLCLDVESNGLHGEAFAVGGVLVSGDGTVRESFEARCPITGQTDSWVEQNVLPALMSLPVTHPDSKSMRQAFWDWYIPAKEQATYVLADNGYPVEARFMIACQEDDLEPRYFSHPFPFIDVSSLLLQAGIPPRTPREEILNNEFPETDYPKHHPKWDALVSTHIALKALQATGQLNRT